MSNSRKKMERAFKLIKRDKTDEALEILRPVVDDEPDNIDAWWLFAYAATEPREVREALVKVLRLDPNYSNAPKAREMLDKLNEEYPPDETETMLYPELQTSSFPDAFGDDLFDSADFGDAPTFSEAVPGEVEDPFSDDIFGDFFDEHASESPVDISGFDTTDDPFAVLDQEATEQETSKKEISKRRKKDKKEPKITSLGLEDEAVDDETRATREEQAYRKQERGGRLVRTLLILALAAVVVVGILALINLGSGSESTDPGELEAVNVESAPVQDVVAVAGNQVRNAKLANGAHVLVAKSSLGNTLFIAICSEPGPDVPQLAATAMGIAAQQAPALAGQLDAIGVSIDTCNAESPDTLYRTFVSIDDALRYSNGDLGSGEAGQAQFQELWKKP